MKSYGNIKVIFKISATLITKSLVTFCRVVAPFKVCTFMSNTLYGQ